MVGSEDPNYRKVAGELGLIYQSVLDEHTTLLDADTESNAAHTQRQSSKMEDELGVE